jgi:aldehyde:ferredoxin oxidoreductase
MTGRPIMSNRILKIDLTRKKAEVYSDKKLYDEFIGGTGVATKLLYDHHISKIDPLSEEAPIILSIGPLNGIYPIATKTIAMFKSPLTGNLGESHAGGRLFMSMYDANLSAIVITGKLDIPSYIAIENENVHFVPANSIWGQSASATERILRSAEKGVGKRSILRIGPAGENLSLMANVSVDTGRHFGRLGLGAVMGSKNLKAIVISGSYRRKMEKFAEFNKIYNEIFWAAVKSPAMKKYHNLGTPQNVIPLNKINSLPTRNFSQGFFEGAEALSGENLAKNYLAQQIACANCPVGCIHLGTLREAFEDETHFKTFKIPYDYEPIYAMGTNLSINEPNALFKLLNIVEKTGWDVMETGITLSWATEAFEEGLIGTKETEGLVLNFGDAETYQKVLLKMKENKGEFFKDLNKGSAYCAEKYGGKEFAINFGRNGSPGYITGRDAFLGFLMGVRHSHLDSAGYSLDEKIISGDLSEDPESEIDMLINEEEWRFILNSLTICLFARKIYTEDLVLRALASVGISKTSDDLKNIAQKIHALKYKIKLENGFNLDTLSFPDKLFRVQTGRGKMDRKTVQEMIEKYAGRIKTLVSEFAD